MRRNNALRSVELKVLSELMKNSKSSDRRIAKMLKVSQPTVTRIRAKLEREGYIKEYTIIPDFAKLGYEILALTFLRTKALSEQKIEEARKVARDSLGKGSANVVMLERGAGLPYNGVLVSYHKSYSSYLELLETLEQFRFLEVDSISSYLVNLKDTVRYKPLTFGTLAQHILTESERESPR